MTEFQQATLFVGWLQTGVALFVGMVQSALFFYGIKRMSDASERRARQTDKQIDAMMKQIEVMADGMAKHHEESMRRTDIMADTMGKQHEESMKRTDALIKLQEDSSKRTDALLKQSEMTMKQSEITMKQSETAMLALRRLLERTAD